MRAYASLFAVSTFALAAVACGSRIDAGGSPPVADEPPVRTPPASDVPIPHVAYDPSSGFVVHEWGTLTSVVGSDGSQQPGLHHEEEDLPSFVVDRMKQVNAFPASGLQRVDAKMETPVTYFYSPKALTVRASVQFPTGIFTQWYPFVERMAPSVLRMESGAIEDRYLQSLDTIPAVCRRSWDQPFSWGMLDWATFEVLAPETSVDLPGGLGTTTWGFARNTAANAISVRGQNEKFLFYRGLGSYDYPVKVGFDGGKARFQNVDEIGPAGGLFLMQVTKTKASFVELGDLSPRGTLNADIPEASGDLRTFVSTLKAKLAARLVQDGLFTDEALAMVDTWERSYFLTPGVRLLYLLPRHRTDALIPLEVSPVPEAMKRTMVIRVEIMPPAYEKQLAGWLTDLAAGSASAKQSFLALGRFAEPHLTRTVALATAPSERAAGEALLTEIRRSRRWAPTAAE